MYVDGENYSLVFSCIGKGWCLFVCLFICLLLLLGFLLDGGGGDPSATLLCMNPECTVHVHSGDMYVCVGCNSVVCFVELGGEAQKPSCN